MTDSPLLPEGSTVFRLDGSPVRRGTTATSITLGNVEVLRRKRSRPIRERCTPMPDTLKKLREPAALAAVGFAGLVLLVAVVNLLAPPSTDGISEPFANRAYDQVTSFLDVVVAAAT